MATPLKDSVGLTDNDLIDGLLQGGQWQLGGSRVITYALHDSEFGTWTAADQQTAQQAAAAWSNVANIQFQRVSGAGDVDSSSADFAASLSGDQIQQAVGAGVALGVFPDQDAGDEFLAALSAFFGIPYDRSVYPDPEGDIFFDNYYQGFNYMSPGGWGFSTAIHEIGHACNRCSIVLPSSVVGRNHLGHPRLRVWMGGITSAFDEPNRNCAGWNDRG